MELIRELNNASNTFDEEMFILVNEIDSVLDTIKEPIEEEVKPTSGKNLPSPTPRDLVIYTPRSGKQTIYVVKKVNLTTVEVVNTKEPKSTIDLDRKNFGLAALSPSPQIKKINSYLMTKYKDRKIWEYK